jgi:hypothetical protein
MLANAETLNNSGCAPGKAETKRGARAARSGAPLGQLAPQTVDKLLKIRLEVGVAGNLFGLFSVGNRRLDILQIQIYRRSFDIGCPSRSPEGLTPTMTLT